MRYDRFHLVLMVTHACNLRCDYCYTGRKFSLAMPAEIGRAAIRRAVRSTRSGGCLELGFFGGEPLLQAAVIGDWIEFAAEQAADARIALRFGLTTNGTILSPAAWRLMLRAGLELCISHDGVPEVHDRHRRRPQGGTALQVADTIARLRSEGCNPRAVMVVRPDSAATLPQGIAWLWDCGARRFDLTLDVWAKWDRAGLESLEIGLRGAADFWRDRLPDIAVNWFDEKAGYLLGLPIETTARCGFGDGQVAVAPSGNLYPCERLIGEDADDNPMRLPVHALQGDDFCRDPGPPLPTHCAGAPGAPLRVEPAAECSGCVAQRQCGTFCRCNNYVRTGNVGRPDALLCFLDRVRVRETARVLQTLAAAAGTGIASDEGNSFARSIAGSHLCGAGALEQFSGERT